MAFGACRANVSAVHALFQALAFAAALTSVTAFRFDMKRRAIGLYFGGVAALELAAHLLFLPEDVIPIEAAFVLLGITVLFVVTNLILRRFAPE